MPKIDSNYTCLAIISLDSDLKKDSNYYPQVFLKECKYIEKNISMIIGVTFLLFLMILVKNNFFS